MSVLWLQTIILLSIQMEYGFLLSWISELGSLLFAALFLCILSFQSVRVWFAFLCLFIVLHCPEDGGVTGQEAAALKPSLFQTLV